MAGESERQRIGDDAGATGGPSERGSAQGLATDAIVTEVDRVRADNDFTSRATRLLNRDQEVLDALGE